MAKQQCCVFADTFYNICIVLIKATLKAPNELKVNEHLHVDFPVTVWKVLKITALREVHTKTGNLSVPLLKFS